MVKHVIHKQTKKDYAVKMINKSICDNNELIKEVEIMRAIDEHPGVIHLIDVYEDSQNFNLILELFVNYFSKIIKFI